jgi:hypothetical protein
MYSTLMLVALSGVLSSSSLLDEPAWLTDYAAARKQARAVQKPLAVFLGSGKAGWERLSKEGKLEKQAKRVLAGEYVCVYLDTAKAGGRDLASAFEIPNGTGLVISDRTGGLQAFSHEGNLANKDLMNYLKRYAEPERVVQATETNPARRSNYYQPAYQQQWAQPNYYNPPPAFSPMFFGGGSFGGGGRGGC